MKKYLVSLAVLSSAAALLSGCQKESAQPTAATSASAPAGLTQLPVSINAAMVALTSQAADYLFAPGNGDMPKNDRDWALVQNAGYEIMLAGKVMQVPGTGEFDAQWVAEAEWIKLANELTDIGSEAEKLAAAKSTDRAQWQAVGDKLVQNCLACHEMFKPDTPSQGILHGATKRESLGESIFPTTSY